MDKLAEATLLDCSQPGWPWLQLQIVGCISSGTHSLQASTC